MGDVLGCLPPHAAASTLFETNNLTLRRIWGFLKRGKCFLLTTGREYPLILYYNLRKQPEKADTKRLGSSVFWNLVFS